MTGYTRKVGLRQPVSAWDRYWGVYLRYFGSEVDPQNPWASILDQTRAAQGDFERTAHG